MKETFIDMLIPPDANDRPYVLFNSLLPTQSRQSDSSASSVSLRAENPTFHASRSVSRSSTYEQDAERLPIAAHFATNRSIPSVQDLFLCDDNDPNASAANQRQTSIDNHASPPRQRSDAQGDEPDADATVRIKRIYHFLTREGPGEEKHTVVAMIPNENRGSPPSHCLPNLESDIKFHPYGSLEHRQPTSNRSRRSLYLSPSTSPPASTSRLGSSIRKRISSVTSSSDLNHQPAALPEDLQIVLQVIGDTLLKGHVALSDALRKRYDEQYPLVRSLADIFIQHVSVPRCQKAHRALYTKLLRSRSSPTSFKNIRHMWSISKRPCNSSMTVSPRLRETRNASAELRHMARSLSERRCG